MSSRFSAVALFAFSLSLPAFAQQIELPRPSPNGKITQTVGLTDISVEYSSPAVHGREIWGALEPWGEVWRAGANATTKVTFSKDVTVGTTVVPAGSYAFFVIPNKDAPWTLILNKDYMQGGAFNYKKDLDVARVDVKPTPIANRERLAYVVSDFNNDMASLDLEWEKVRLSLPIKLGTDAQIAEKVKNVENGNIDPYTALANYELSIKQDYTAGLEFAEKSIRTKMTWQNLWAKAQLEAAQKQFKKAVASLEKAITLAKDAPKFFADTSAKQLAEWKTKK